MNCKGIKGLLFDFIDKKLDPVLEDKVREHLKNCDTCVKEIEQLREL